MRTLSIYKLPYATFADYSPKGSSDKSRRSQSICAKLKDAKPDILESLIAELLKPEAREFYSDFLNPSVTLVPTPRSAPIAKDQLWPSAILAKALVSAGLAKEVSPCLLRVSPVPRSSTAGRGNRPVVETHYQSFAVDKSLIVPKKITLIDDVLSMGRTVFAGALRLQEAYPRADINVFAVLRTRGFVPEIDKVKNFICSEILESGGGGCRRIDPEGD